MYNHEEYAKLTPGERSLYEWQFKMSGGFFTSLWDAISRADSQNLYHLEKAFPSHLKAWGRYQGESGWWEELVERVGRP